MSPGIIRLATVVVLIIILVLVGRAIVWWYFGIDRALKLLASIDESLKQLPAVRQHYYQAKRN
jgi:hypothetical protein